MTGFPPGPADRFLLSFSPLSAPSTVSTSTDSPVGSCNNVNAVLANEQVDLSYGTVFYDGDSERARGDRQREMSGLYICHRARVSMTISSGTA